MPDDVIGPDDLDGCSLDFAEAAVDDETAGLLPLFPDGVADETKVAQWRELFGQGKTP